MYITSENIATFYFKWNDCRVIMFFFKKKYFKYIMTEHFSCHNFYVSCFCYLEITNVQFNHRFYLEKMSVLVFTLNDATLSTGTAVSKKDRHFYRKKIINE